MTNLREVIRDKSVSRPLGKEPDGDENDQPVAVARRFPELGPLALLEFSFE